MTGSLLPIAISALTLGSVYALMAVGLALIWGGMGVLNLAQGALFMMGGYAAFTVSRYGGGPWLGLFVAALVTGAFGLLLYLGPVRPLLARADGGNAVLIATISIASILESIALTYYGPRTKVVPELAGGAFRLFGTPVTYNAILIMLVSVALLGALAACLKSTRTGLAIRAVAQNIEGTQLSGMNPRALFAFVFAISSALAGVGGVLLSSIYFVTPYVGQTYLLTALIVTILGGLGSVTGTLYAAYAVGAIQAFVSFYFGVRWSLPVLFMAIIATLVFMPTGLAGIIRSKRL
jgi:branched-chain amino acid transport system permease protein